MYALSEIWTIAKTEQGNAVLLRPVKSQVVVPIFIGQMEAQSILIGMGSVPMPRPNTHELLLRLLKLFQLNLEQVEITHIQEGVFIAGLVLRGPKPQTADPSGTERFYQDARPSDALALAVREKCPIYMSEAVIEEAGIPMENFLNDRDELSQLNELKIHNLKEALNKAVLDEDYEEAARLRDLLLVLEKEPPDFS